MCTYSLLLLLLLLPFPLLPLLLDSPYLLSLLLPYDSRSIPLPSLGISQVPSLSPLYVVPRANTHSIERRERRNKATRRVTEEIIERELSRKEIGNFMRSARKPNLNKKGAQHSGDIFSRTDRSTGLFDAKDRGSGRGANM